MNELKYAGRTFKPVMYLSSLSSQEVHLNVGGGLKTNQTKPKNTPKGVFNLKEI